MAKFPILPLLAHLGFDEMQLRETGPGQWRKIRCAIHDERHESASYMAFEDQQAFNCKACDAKGDAIALARQQLNLSYSEAVHFLSELSGQSADAFLASKPERYKPVRIGETARPAQSTAAPAAKKHRHRKRARLG